MSIFSIFRNPGPSATPPEKVLLILGNPHKYLCSSRGDLHAQRLKNAAGRGQVYGSQRGIRGITNIRTTKMLEKALFRILSLKYGIPTLTRFRRKYTFNRFSPGLKFNQPL